MNKKTFTEKDATEYITSDIKAHGQSVAMPQERIKKGSTFTIAANVTVEEFVKTRLVWVKFGDKSYYAVLDDKNMPLACSNLYALGLGSDKAQALYKLACLACDGGVNVICTYVGKPIKAKSQDGEEFMRPNRRWRYEVLKEKVA